MSGWGRNLWNGGGRFSPFGAGTGTSTYPPQVSDEDYSYITADDLSAPAQSYDHPPSSRVPARPSADDDIIMLKIGGSLFPVHFTPYSIDDGMLSVADLKARAAEIAGVPDARQIRLLYKGRHLKDDHRQCRDEGLKIDSEVLCVVSDDVDPSRGFSQSDSVDDDEGTDSGDESSLATGDKARRKRNRTRKKKSKKSGSNSGATDSPHLAPPDAAAGAATSRPTSPAVPKTALEKLNDISSRFHTQLLPQSIQFTNNPPSDPAKRDYEHKKLTETILSQVLLKLDAVETEGDADARQRRKDLVKETQGVLNGLDAVIKRRLS